MVQFVFIGIGAGIASALLFLAPLGGTSFALPLFFLSGLPIAIAGLGWGVLAAVLAAAIAAAIIGLGIAPPAGGIQLAVFGAPLAWLTRMALLSRSSPDGRTTEWFPLGRLLFHAVIAAAAGTVIAGAIVGFDPAALAADMTAMLTTWMSGSPELGPPPTAAELAPFVRANIALMPFTVPAITLFVTVLNLWLAARIVSASGRLARPREPVWTAALPIAAPILFVIALAVLLLVPGPVGTIASAAAGAVAAAAALAGLAVLHAVTLGTNLRGGILVAAYVATVFLGVPIFLFALLGFADTFFHFRARRSGGAPPPATT
jgi:hypothetical protein